MSSSLERGVELVRRFCVCARRDLRVAVDDRHARAEAGEDLRELEADRAAADDEQRLGYLLELERGHVVDPIDLLDPGTRGTAVREPEAMRMRSPVSSRSPTRSVCASTNVASPGTSS